MPCYAGKAEQNNMQRQNTSSIPIPHFALYGESETAHKPEFAHIEHIRERSERNGWLIKPHRHTHLFQLLFIISGGGEVRMDTRNSTHKGSWLITMPPGVVHGFRFTPGTHGLVLSLAMATLGLDAENQLRTLLQGPLTQPQILRAPRNSATYRELFHYFGMISQELADPREDQQIALFSLVKLVLVILRRQLLQQKQASHVQSGSVQLVNRFRSLLEQHYKNHWKIDAYADALHVSVSTLSRACQTVLGCSTKKLMRERLHIEAKRRLIYTAETLDQISWDLGFKDASYFSRTFKQLEGTSPKTFRLQTDHVRP
jgi:AraC family transcriptional activator of pobA